MLTVFKYLYIIYIFKNYFLLQKEKLLIMLTLNKIHYYSGTKLNY